MKFILGKKIGMTQIWKEEEVISVTKIQAGPCLVIQVKNEKKDGYQGLQLAFDDKKEKNINKPQKGHCQKLKNKNKNLKINWRYLREFRLLTDEDKQQEVNMGDVISVETFEVRDKIDVSGTSKGRGFQGVVKRHNFSGASKTHGTKDQERMPGSAGAMGVGRILKGKKMPGKMGNKTITITNLEIVDIDIDNNILFLKGAVAGAINGLVTIKGKGELKLSQSEDFADVLEKSVAEQKQEQSAEQQNKEQKENFEESKQEQVSAQEQKGEQSEEQPEQKDQDSTKEAPEKKDKPEQQKT